MSQWEEEPCPAARAGMEHPGTPGTSLTHSTKQNHPWSTAAPGDPQETLENLVRVLTHFYTGETEAWVGIEKLGTRPHKHGAAGMTLELELLQERRKLIWDHLPRDSSLQHCST